MLSLKTLCWQKPNVICFEFRTTSALRLLSILLWRYHQQGRFPHPGHLSIPLQNPHPARPLKRPNAPSPHDWAPACNQPEQTGRTTHIALPAPSPRPQRINNRDQMEQQRLPLGYRSQRRPLLHLGTAQRRNPSHQPPHRRRQGNQRTQKTQQLLLLLHLLELQLLTLRSRLPGKHRRGRQRTWTRRSSRLQPTRTQSHLRTQQRRQPIVRGN